MQDKLENTNCAVCDSAQFSVLFQNNDRLYHGDYLFTIVSCDECGLVYLNPRPKKEFLGELYPATYTPHNLTSSNNIYLKLATVLSRSYYKQQKKSVDRVKSILFRFIYPSISLKYQGRILDIGCGNGAQLHVLEKSGWDVYGLDMSEKAVQSARKQFGLKNVAQGFMDDATYPADFFDVVIMSARH